MSNKDSHPQVVVLSDESNNEVLGKRDSKHSILTDDSKSISDVFSSKAGSPMPDERLPRFLRFLNWFSNWPASARALIYIITGSGLLIIPALVTWLLFDNKSIKDMYNEDYPKSPKTALIFWFFLLSNLFAVYISADYVVSFLPALILRVVRLLFGKYYVELLRSRLEYVNQLHRYLAMIVTMAVAITLGQVFNLAPANTTEGRIFVCILIGAILLFGEKLVVQSAAVGFHQKAYAERIVKNQFFEYTLERLNESRKIMKKKRKGDIRSPPAGVAIGAWLKNVGNGQLLKKKSGDLGAVGREKNSTDDLLDKASQNLQKEEVVKESYDNAKTKKSNILAAPFNFVSAVTEVTGVNAVMRGTRGVVSNVTNAALSTFLTGSSSDTDIKSAEQAKSLAKSIFNFLSDNSSTVTVEDFYYCFPTKEEAEKAFKLFDADGNNDLSKQEMISAVLAYYQDKKSVDRGLSDLGDTVGKLDSLLMGCMLVLLFLICLVIFGVSVQSYLVAFGSLLVTSAVIVGQAAKNVVTSVIFLFVYHPFDVGDKVIINKETFIVKKMDLTVTTFHRVDGSEIYCPNEKLADIFIYNIRRSPHQCESVEIKIDMNTDREKIEHLEEKMVAFVEANSREFYPNIDMTVEEIEAPTETEQGKLKVKMWIRHRSNFQDQASRIKRRNKFVLGLKDVLVELDIFAVMPKVD